MLGGCHFFPPLENSLVFAYELHTQEKTGCGGPRAEGVPSAFQRGKRRKGRLNAPEMGSVQAAVKPS